VESPEFLAAELARPYPGAAGVAREPNADKLGAYALRPSASGGPSALGANPLGVRLNMNVHPLCRFVNTLRMGSFAGHGVSA
jgi:hypothetical protein